MTSAEYQQYLARFCPPTHNVQWTAERELHEQILDECRRRGWIAFHGSMTHRTHRTIGEPDFVILADRGRCLLVEVKGTSGKVTAEQAALHAWAAKLDHTVHVVRSLTEFLALT